MTAIKTRIVRFLVLSSVILGALPIHATQYNVHVDTSSLQGAGGAVVFDFTSTDLADNTVTILNFSHDGNTGLPETQGGLVQGDIILLLNPAPFTTIDDSAFFNELLVPFTSFGNFVDFTLQITENAPAGGDLPDELSFFLLDFSRQPLFATSDPLGAHALFAICVDGTTTGLLSVFDPTVFSKPDDLEIVVPPVVLFADGFESGDVSAWSP